MVLSAAKVRKNTRTLKMKIIPPTTVTHYRSFYRYSYLNCLADIGGFYTLVAGLYFIAAPLLVKIANRGQLTYRARGILPAFSLSHRNAEELSALRSLLFAAVGITEDQYFSKMLEKLESKKQVN